MRSAFWRLLGTCRRNGNVVSGNAAACVASRCHEWHGRRRELRDGTAVLSSLGGTQVMGQVIDLQEWRRRRSQVPAKAAEPLALRDTTGIVWMEPILSSSLLWHSMVTMWVGLWLVPPRRQASRRVGRPGSGASGWPS